MTNPCELFSLLLVVAGCLNHLAGVNSNELFERGRQSGASSTSCSSSSSGKLLSRQKRYLIFPQGSNIQLVYCLTANAHGRKGDLVMGLTAALAWELPTKVDSKVSHLLHRQSRSIMFPKIEAFLQSTGLDGRSCVMRALCEAGQRDKLEIGSGTFIQELLHAVFTLPNDASTFLKQEHQVYDYSYNSRLNCAKTYPTCQYSINNLQF